MQVQVNVGRVRTSARFAAGESAAFSVETFPGETFHGTVSQVRLQPVTEQAATGDRDGRQRCPRSPAQTTSVATVVSYTAIVDVANPDQRLRPGMTAECRVVWSRRASTWSASRIPRYRSGRRRPS